MEKLNIAIFFGGNSPEHEVSVISGLQILKNIDKQKYSPVPIYVDKKGYMNLLERYLTEKDFYESKRSPISFGKDETGGYVLKEGILGKKIYVDCAYLAFHGGDGEQGIFQGMLETFSIPYTSPNVESSVLCMNKQLSKLIVSQQGVSVVDGKSYSSKEIRESVDSVVSDVKKNIAIPVIIKPVHLGSSIGLSVAKDEIELKKGLLSSALLDDEILVEKFLTNFVEYNISVSSLDKGLVFSQIERPIKKDEILSFKDKYQEGAKGKLKTGGMASLSRELPAKINSELEAKIIEDATKIYNSLKCKGQVRIDFIFSNETLYFSEINPIPGSLAFYLWEGKGESFTEQITRVIEDALNNYPETRKYSFDYTTDIVEKYIKAVSKRDR